MMQGRATRRSGGAIVPFEDYVMNRSEFLSLSPEQFLELNPADVDWLLNPQEFFYLGEKLDAYWQLDPNQTSYHAELNSGDHADRFFASKHLTCHENIRQILGRQLAMVIGQNPHLRKFEYIAAIPDSATPLAEPTARALGKEIFKLEKKDGVIQTVTKLPEDNTLLLIEDVFTTGKAFLQTLDAVYKVQPDAKIVGGVLTLLNRNGAPHVKVDPQGMIPVYSIVSQKFDSWKPDQCPHCQRGSKAIKPKIGNNWQLLKAS